MSRSTINQTIRIPKISSIRSRKEEIRAEIMKIRVTDRKREDLQLEESTDGEKADRRVHQHCPTCARQTRIESSIEGGNGRISESQNLAGTAHHPSLPAGRELCQVHRAQGCGTWEIQPLSSSVPPRANDPSFRNRVWPASRPGITHNTAFPNQGWTRVRREKHPGADLGGARFQGCTSISSQAQHTPTSTRPPFSRRTSSSGLFLDWAAHLGVLLSYTLCPPL